MQKGLRNWVGSDRQRQQATEHMTKVNSMQAYKWSTKLAMHNALQQWLPHTSLNPQFYPYAK